MERKQIARTVVIALFTALTAAGAFIRIPMIPVPMTLQTLFALLTATCLGPVMAVTSIALYLILGTIGLPIFTTGGGIAALLGPTGGFLFGMLPAVLVGSLMMKAMPHKGRIASLLSAIIATVIIYLAGLPWLSMKMDITLASAVASGLLPFIVGDTMKIAVTTAVAPVIRPRIAELVEREA